MTAAGLHVDAADLRRPRSRASAWIRGHPTVIDVVVVLVACGPHLAALTYRSGELGWWGYPLVGITAAALMVRRRWPFGVLIVVAVACAVSPLAQPGFGFPTVPFAFALYTVASLRGTSRALIGYGIAIAVTALATVPYSLSGTPPPLVTLADPFSLIALAAGIAVKSRRDRAQWLADDVNRRVENAALTERTRIAAEMHDVVAHSLTVVVTLANGAVSAWDRHPERAKAAVVQIGEVGRDALGDMRRTIGMLRHADAPVDAGLHRPGDDLRALAELADGFREAGLPVTVTRSGPPLPADPALTLAVYRIAQESLTNTLRHALRPSGAEVAVEHVVGKHVAVTIEDDGGSAGRPRSPGHGLVGVAERAAALGGHAESGPRPGGGWRTRAVLRTETDAP